MKKSLAILLVAVLVMGVMAGMVSASEPAPRWNIEGTWISTNTIDSDVTYRYLTITEQDEDGNILGVLGFSDELGTIGEQTGVIDGWVRGSEVYIRYTRPELTTGYESYRTGTIASDGKSMSGRLWDTSGNEGTWIATGEAISLYKAAPAIAVQLLKDAEIPHRYGDRKSGGNLIADVAHEMGPGSDFRDVSKYDTCAYRYEIAMFLNERLEALSMEERVEVPQLLYALYISSVNGNTGFWHDITIYYDVNTQEGWGTGVTHGGDMQETISDVILDGDLLTFTSTYDSGYVWNPTFELESNGTLTFVEGNTGGVLSAEGTWSLTYICE